MKARISPMPHYKENNQNLSSDLKDCSKTESSIFNTKSHDKLKNKTNILNPDSRSNKILNQQEVFNNTIMVNSNGLDFSPVDMSKKTQRTKTRSSKKINHNVVEKRYRCAIKNKLEELKNLVFDNCFSINPTKALILKKAICKIQELQEENKFLKSQLNNNSKNYNCPSYYAVQSLVSENQYMETTIEDSSIINIDSVGDSQRISVFPSGYHMNDYSNNLNVFNIQNNNKLAYLPNNNLLLNKNNIYLDTANLKTCSSLFNTANNSSLLMSHAFNEKLDPKLYSNGSTFIDSSPITNPSYCNSVFDSNANQISLNFEQCLIEQQNKPANTKPVFVFMFGTAFIVFYLLLTFFGYNRLSIALSNNQMLNDVWTFDDDTTSANNSSFLYMMVIFILFSFSIYLLANYMNLFKYNFNIKSVNDHFIQSIELLNQNNVAGSFSYLKHILDTNSYESTSFILPNFVWNIYLKLRCVYSIIKLFFKYIRFSIHATSNHSPLNSSKNNIHDSELYFIDERFKSGSFSVNQMDNSTTDKQKLQNYLSFHSKVSQTFSLMLDILLRNQHIIDACTSNKPNVFFDLLNLFSSKRFFPNNDKIHLLSEEEMLDYCKCYSENIIMNSIVFISSYCFIIDPKLSINLLIRISTKIFEDYPKTSKLFYKIAHFIYNHHLDRTKDPKFKTFSWLFNDNTSKIWLNVCRKIKDTNKTGIVFTDISYLQINSSNMINHKSCPISVFKQIDHLFLLSNIICEEILLNMLIALTKIDIFFDEKTDHNDKHNRPQSKHSNIQSKQFSQNQYYLLLQQFNIMQFIFESVGSYQELNNYESSNIICSTDWWRKFINKHILLLFKTDLISNHSFQMQSDSKKMNNENMKNIDLSFIDRKLVAAAGSCYGLLSILSSESTTESLYNKQIYDSINLINKALTIFKHSSHKNYPYEVLSLYTFHLSLSVQIQLYNKRKPLLLKLIESKIMSTNNNEQINANTYKNSSNHFIEETKMNEQYYKLLYNENGISEKSTVSINKMRDSHSDNKPMKIWDNVTNELKSVDRLVDHSFYHLYDMIWIMLDITIRSNFIWYRQTIEKVLKQVKIESTKNLNLNQLA